MKEQDRLIDHEWLLSIGVKHESGPKGSDYLRWYSFDGMTIRGEPCESEPDESQTMVLYILGRGDDDTRLSKRQEFIDKCPRPAQTFERRIANAVNVIYQVIGSPMHAACYDTATWLASQHAAKQKAIAWIMDRFSGHEERRPLAIEKLNELIPLDQDWDFTTGGRGIGYQLMRSLEFDVEKYGSPSLFRWFRCEMAVISFSQCIIVHDESEPCNKWTCLTTWIAENDG